MVKSKELNGTAEYLTLQKRCEINRCRYNRVVLCVYLLNFKPSVPAFCDISNERYAAGSNLNFVNYDFVQVVKTM